MMPDRAGSLADRASTLDRIDLLWIGLAIVVALAFRVVFYQGVFSIDDFNYLRHANEVRTGTFDLEGILYWHGMRPLVFVPISWCFSLFGVTEQVATLWPLVAGLGVVVVVYLLTLDLHGREAAIFAALGAAYLPMGVIESTRVMPGVIVNLLVALSAFAFVRSEVTGRWRAGWLGVAGLMYALIPWAGHLGLVFGAFFPLAILVFRRHGLWTYWPLVAGGVGAALAMTLYQGVSAGNAFANLDVAQKVLDSENATPKPLYYFRLLAWPLASHGGLFFVAGVGALVALVKRRRGPVLVTAWFVLVYLVIEFGSSSLTDYRPLFKQERYLSIVLVPGAILAGIGLGDLRIALRSRARGLAMVVPVAVVALTLIGAVRTIEYRTAWGQIRRAELGSLAGLVREHRGEVVYVMHWLWNTRVGFFMNYAPEYAPSGYAPYHALRLDRVDPGSRNRYVQSLVPGEAMAPGILLVDEALLEASRSPVRRVGLVGPGEVPEVLAEIPERWPLLARVGSVAVYDVRGGPWPTGPGSVAPFFAGR